MSLLFSNFPPLKTPYPTYAQCFKNLLGKSDHLKIATGYISSDSAIDLKNIIMSNRGPRTDLCIGMHYFEGLSRLQKNSLEELDNHLKLNNLGGVYLVTTFPYHGKVVSFSSANKVLGSIIGSSNLSNIIEGQRQYEVDYLFDPSSEADSINHFIDNLILVSSKPINELELKIIEEQNPLLSNHTGVEKIGDHDLKVICENLTDIKFLISLKGEEAPKSNLNVFFGEGRRNTQDYIIPRPWYEVELIVPKKITETEYYPKVGTKGETFTVVTDDGWRFKCRVSGDHSKNFRSADDLLVLGKWIKGRLEMAGVLKPGELVTDRILENYGRINLDFIKLKNSDEWYLDFGVKNE